MRLFRRDRPRGPGRFAEFLPDAEGVVERGHSPFAGVLIMAVAGVFGGLLAWSALAEVEQVVRAEGKVEPAGRVKVINHPDGGRIAEIHVEEGAHVGAGDPLVTFDRELARAERAELLGQWQQKRAEAVRLQAEVSDAEPAFPPELVAARPDLVAEQTELLEQRRQAHASRAEALASMVERRRSEVRSLAAELARLGDSHALLEQEVGAVRGLAQKGLYPRLKLVGLERQLSDLAGEIREARERLRAAEAALAEAESRHEGLERERRSRGLGELAITKAQQERLADAIDRQEALLRNLVVRAPVAGIVQDLEVAGPGQSVGSNQPIMRIVPTGGGLVIEAKVANRDIGYLKVGQSARIKFRAYDFLRYGALDGWVERIAADAEADPRTGALTYRISVHTRGATLEAGGEKVSVLPGMAADVDLLVGDRTVLSYLTDRIFRLREAAFSQG